MMTKIPSGTYKLVKYCRACKKRMVLPKSESKRNYCEPCEKKVIAHYAKQDKENEKKSKT